MEKIIPIEYEKTLEEKGFTVLLDTPLMIKLAKEETFEEKKIKSRQIIVLLGNENPGIIIRNESPEQKHTVMVNAEDLEVILNIKKKQQDYLEFMDIKETKFEKQVKEEVEDLEKMLKEKFFEVFKKLKELTTLNDEEIKLHPVECPYCKKREDIPMSIGIRLFGENEGIRECEHCKETYTVNYHRDLDAATTDVIEKFSKYNELKKVGIVKWLTYVLEKDYHNENNKLGKKKNKLEERKLSM